MFSYETSWFLIGLFFFFSWEHILCLNLCIGLQMSFAEIKKSPNGITDF